MLINLSTIPVQTTSNYPKPFKTQVAGRQKQRVGDAAGLTNFGVNWVTLAPSSASALRHWHQCQDEFIYVISGELILVTNEGETPITAGMMAAFPAGEANGHHLVNRSADPAVYLEIGDRTPADQVQYPDDDLVAHQTPEGWAFSHRDGRPYSDGTP
jgi:uncharacterized cupin superfamily protein